jgi:pyridoxine 5-phosphate synthase
MKLGVNIDHIATLREARKTNEPDPVYGAVLAELAGADGITIHLRQDRRHMQERDLQLLTAVVKSKLNLEMAATMEMVKIALKYKPKICTLVPESPDEVTTSGGLEMSITNEDIMEVISNLRAEGLEISIFVDPDLDQIKACHKLDIKKIEINTGEYAKNWNTSFRRIELERIQKAVNYSRKLGITVLAGHGLTYQNVHPIAAITEIEELNIGHSIIANAAFMGLEEAVRKMKNLINNPGEDSP